MDLLAAVSEWRGFDFILLGITLISLTYSEYRFLRSHASVSPVANTSVQAVSKAIETQWFPAIFRALIQGFVLLILYLSGSESESAFILGTLLFSCMTFVDFFEITAMKRSKAMLSS